MSACALDCVRITSAATGVPAPKDTEREMTVAPVLVRCHFCMHSPKIYPDSEIDTQMNG